jgi:hypothetical protein
MATCPHCGHPLPDRRGTVHAYSGQHLRVIYLLAEAARPLTHEQLVRRWEAKSARAGALSWPFAASSSVRTYTSELTRWGLVEPSGATARTLANRPARTWQLSALSPATANLQLDDFGLSVLHGLVDEAKASGDLPLLAALGAAA